MLVERDLDTSFHGEVENRIQERSVLAHGIESGEPVPSAHADAANAGLRHVALQRGDDLVEEPRDLFGELLRRATATRRPALEKPSPSRIE